MILVNYRARFIHLYRGFLEEMYTTEKDRARPKETVKRKERREKAAKKKEDRGNN